MTKFFMALIALTILIALALAFLYLVANLVTSGFIKLNNLFIRNKLYICKDFHCKRLYRHYQSTMSSKKNHYCPHCQDWKITQKKIKEEKWVRNHTDCPRLNLTEYIKFEIMIHKIKKNKKTVEDVEFFERYNSKKPNTEWLNNITKSKK